MMVVAMMKETESRRFSGTTAGSWNVKFSLRWIRPLICSDATVRNCVCALACACVSAFVAHPACKCEWPRVWNIDCAHTHTHTHHPTPYSLPSPNNLSGLLLGYHKEMVCVCVCAHVCMWVCVWWMNFHFLALTAVMWLQSLREKSFRQNNNKIKILRQIYVFVAGD